MTIKGLARSDPRDAVKKSKWRDMRTGLILKGLATYIPVLYRPRKTGGSVSARYCYSVWLRHLVVAHKNGFSIPNSVAELGPGDSLGIGLAALLCGANNYYGLDAVPYCNDERNLKVFEELVGLFTQREHIPDQSEFPNVKPHLDSYDFPSKILPDKVLKSTLDKDRVQAIRAKLVNWDITEDADVRISYLAPWYDVDVMEEASVDMIYSQAVLEHVDKLEDMYSLIYRWLKPRGLMSHDIDFKSHGTAHEWNGHWAYPELIWKLMRGNRPYYLNRQPHSVHIDLLVKAGFEVICDITTRNVSGVERGRFRPDLGF